MNCKPYYYLSLVAVISVSACTAEPKKPNILYIMADDHTTHGFGIYGSRLAALNPTPNLNQIAREGIVFENAGVRHALPAIVLQLMDFQVGDGHESLFGLGAEIPPIVVVVDVPAADDAGGQQQKHQP